MRMEEGNIRRIMDSLVDKGLVNVVAKKEGEAYEVVGKIDLPPNPLHELISSIGKREIVNIDSIATIPPNLQQKEIPSILKKLWGSITVKEVSELYLPIWEGVMKKKTGEERIERIDAINGNRIA
jgi:hypothetical protein